MANLVNVIVILNEKESSVVYDPNNSVSDLKRVISLSQNISIDTIDLYYKNQKILNEKLSLYDVIGGESVPVFYVFAKNMQVKHKFYRKKFLEEKKDFHNKIIVENYPSRAEIYTLLNGFAETNNILFEYTTVNRTNNIEIDFKNAENSNQFINILEKMKAINPLYSKLKVYFINVDSATNTMMKNKTLSNPDEILIQSERFNENNLKNDFFDSNFGVNEGLLRHLTNKNNLINDMKKLNVDDHSKFYKSENFSKQIINELYEHKEEFKKPKLNKETLFSKLKHEKEEENSEKQDNTPLNLEKEKINKSQVDKNDKKTKKDQKKKELKKNIINPNENQKIVKFLGKLRGKDPAIISNYVFMTPSEPVSKYQFRIEHKDKWIAHNNFHV